MYHLAVVDDNDTWCFVMRQLLRQHNYEVSTFTDVEEFFQAAAQFDLALIDFSMPARRYQHQVDGPDVIRWVKQQVANPPLLVLVSSYFTEDVLNQLPEMFPQPDAFLSKQTDSSLLIQTIQKLLETRKSQTRLASSS